MENKTKSDIIIDERISQVDDVNLDKLFCSQDLEIDEINDTSDDILIPDIDFAPVKSEMLDSPDTVFSLEVMPNEFLDNISFREEEKKEDKRNISVNARQLFFALTSIAVLLCILFIYNLFVLGGLERRVATMTATAYTYQVTEVENDYISFSTGHRMQINNQNSSFAPFAQTNWFNDTCDNLNQLFGGNY